MYQQRVQETVERKRYYVEVGDHHKMGVVDTYNPVCTRTNIFSHGLLWSSRPNPSEIIIHLPTIYCKLHEHTQIMTYLKLLNKKFQLRTGKVPRNVKPDADVVVSLKHVELFESF